ncbi:MAG: thioredoxin [Gammaproteobacteria bacterium RIFCSPLOWO2_02_FULL_61_13]|nr:MAG: thioredoxin [Gammaproteobacteria bacterium RIFCSPLOWO2_02_FULL_61_13]
MKVEIFYSAGCTRCAAGLENLKAAAQQAVKQLEWREINVLEEIDYAVDLGVLTLPAIAVDGVLVFASLPNVRQFRDCLVRRIAKEG